MSRKRKRNDRDEPEHQPPQKRSKIRENLRKEVEEAGYGTDCIGDEKDQDFLASLSPFEREQELFHRWERDQDKKTHGGSGNSEISLGGSSSRITSGYRKFEDKSKFEDRDSTSEEEESPRNLKARMPPPRTPNTPDEDDFVDQTESFSEDEDLDDDENLTSRKESNLRSRKSSKKREINVVDYSTLKSCCLTRKKLLKCYEEPYFSKMCVKSFVRVFLGNNPKTGDNVYRLAQIDQVKDSDEKGYFSDELRRKLYKILILKIGASTRSFKLVHISNEVPSNKEYQFWYKKVKEEYRKGRMRAVPTVREMKRHFREDIQDIHIRYTHTNEEIENKLSNRIEKRQYSEMTTYELDMLAMNLRNRIKVLRDENNDGNEESKKRKRDLQMLQKERERKRLINQRKEDPRLANMAFRARQKNKTLLGQKGGPMKSKKHVELDPFHRTETRSTFLDALMGGKVDEETPKTPLGQFTQEDMKATRMKEIKQKKKQNKQTEKEAHALVDLDLGDALGGMDEMEITF